MPTMIEIRDAILALSEAIGAAELPASRQIAEVHDFTAKLCDISRTLAALARGLDAFDAKLKEVPNAPQ